MSETPASPGGGTPMKTWLRLLAAAALLVPVILAANSDTVRAGLDFGYFYSSGAIVAQGHAARLYDAGEQQRAQERILGRTHPVLVPYPPFQALLFAPLARLGLTPAYLLFGVLNVSLWLLFLGLAERHNPAAPTWFFWFFPPLWIGILHGQFSILLLIAFTLAFLALERGQEFCAGAILALGLMKFTVLIPFVLIFALRRRWRFVAGFTSAAAGLGLVSFAFLGFAGMNSYATLLVDVFRNGGEGRHFALVQSMPTLRGLVGLIGLPPLAAAAVWAGLSVAAIIAVASARGELDGIFAAAIAVSLATAPHLYDYDLTALLLAFFLAIRAARFRAVVIAATAALFLAKPIYSAVPAAAPFLAIVLLIFAGAVLEREPATSSVATPAKPNPRVAAHL